MSQYKGYLTSKGFIIEGYPTIYFAQGENKEMYTGGRTSEAILEAYNWFLRKY